MKDHPALDAMERLGGSFVKALARLARVADSDNYEALVVAFPDHFEKYKRIAKEDADPTTEK